MSNLMKDSDGNESTKRWFGAICLVVAVGLAVTSMFVEKEIGVDLIRSFLWPAAVVLTGGTAAEQLKVFRK